MAWIGTLCMILSISPRTLEFFGHVLKAKQPTFERMEKFEKYPL
jgi:hypothetical protein